MDFRTGLALFLTFLLLVVTGWLTLTPNPLPSVAVPGTDKLHHLLAFASLAFPIAMVRPRWIPAVALGLAVFGGTIEVIQPWVGRGRELADWIADLQGIALGSLAGLLLSMLFARQSRTAARSRG